MTTDYNKTDGQSPTTRKLTGHNSHKTQTYNICMTKHSHFPYTSTYSSTHHNTNRNTTSITSTTQTPLPSSEQTNLPSSNHTYTKSTPNHIHHHYPLCNTYIHDTHHLFNCTHIRTTLSPLDLWTDPAGVMELLARWRDKLVGGPKAG